MEDGPIAQIWTEFTASQTEKKEQKLDWRENRVDCCQQSAHSVSLPPTRFASWEVVNSSEIYALADMAESSAEIMLCNIRGQGNRGLVSQCQWRLLVVQKLQVTPSGVEIIEGATGTSMGQFFVLSAPPWSHASFHYAREVVIARSYSLPQ